MMKKKKTKVERGLKLKKDKKCTVPLLTTV